jgi:hypothetical protein
MTKAAADELGRKLVKTAMAGIMSATAQAAATITVVTIQMLKRGTILPNL